MKFSDWQLSRLRTYLRAFRMFGIKKDGEGKIYSWPSLEEAIEEETNCTFPNDRLRKFCEGERNRNSKEYEFVKLEDERHQAIYDFLVHPENEYMPKDEIDAPEPKFGPPLELIGYLNDPQVAELRPDAKFLAGHYATTYLDMFATRSEFVLEDYIQHDGLFRVSETEELFDGGLANVIDDLNPDDRAQERKSIEKFFGWAVLTPESSLLFFMKSEINGVNHQLISVSAVKRSAEEKNSGRMTIIRHNSPLVFHDFTLNEEKMADHATQKIRDQVQVYERRM